MSPRLYAALPLTWAAIILLLTLTPAVDMPLTPTWKLLSFDTAAHAAVFGLLAALAWCWARRQRRWPRLANSPAWPLLVACVLFGGLIEVLQQTMHQGRHGEWSDLLSDGLGAALALLGLAGWQRLRAGPVAAGLALFAFATTASAQTVAPDTARARCLIEALASPRMHGRGYVRNGDKIAAEYLRKRLRELKLEPLAPDYTQPFALDVNTFPGKMALALGDSATLSGFRLYQQVLLRPGLDYVAASNSAAAIGSWRLIVRLPDSASLYDAASPWWQRASQQARQNWALLVPPRALPLLAALPPPLRQRLDSLPRFNIVPKLTASVGGEVAPGPRFEMSEQAWQSFNYRIKAAVPLQDFVRFTLDAQFKRNYLTQNLAAVIRGTAQPDSFLVVSAHYDHLGMMGKDVYFPGANDNASGVALLLELAAHYARPENRPACSIVFLLFGAEEAGLLGSQYFVQHPLIPLRRIKFLVNLDLLGTGEQGATVVNGRVHEAAYRRLVALNDARHYLPALAPRGRAANSDHYPFSEVGVPAFFLYTRGGSPAYHDVNDRPAALSLAGFAGAFGLVRDFLDSLAR